MDVHALYVYAVVLENTGVLYDQGFMDRIHLVSVEQYQSFYSKILFARIRLFFKNKKETAATC